MYSTVSIRIVPILGMNCCGSRRPELSGTRARVILRQSRDDHPFLHSPAPGRATRTGWPSACWRISTACAESGAQGTARRACITARGLSWRGAIAIGDRLIGDRLMGDRLMGDRLAGDQA